MLTANHVIRPLEEDILKHRWMCAKLRPCVSRWLTDVRRVDAVIYLCWAGCVFSGGPRDHQLERRPDPAPGHAGVAGARGAGQPTARGGLLHAEGRPVLAASQVSHRPSSYPLCVLHSTANSDSSVPCCSFHTCQRRIIVPAVYIIYCTHKH